MCLFAGSRCRHSHHQQGPVIVRQPCLWSICSGAWRTWIFRRRVGGIARRAGFEVKVRDEACCSLPHGRPPCSQHQQRERSCQRMRGGGQCRGRCHGAASRGCIACGLVGRVLVECAGLEAHLRRHAGVHAAPSGSDASGAHVGCGAVQGGLLGQRARAIAHQAALLCAAPPIIAAACRLLVGTSAEHTGAVATGGLLEHPFADWNGPWQLGAGCRRRRVDRAGDIGCAGTVGSLARGAHCPVILLDSFAI
mmetsp:Transcript_121807/g.306498  ORF Transcript_121807/g.306498 Transcript_121807/m.306498 type:complete len:251 (-) Transcript_121807:341-1093(-)